MKKISAAAAAFLTAISLTACSGNAPSATLKKTESSAQAVTCGMNIPFPADWEVLTGDDIYNKLFDNSPGNYADVKELKKSYENSGSSYIVYAADPSHTAMISLTTLKITPDENTGESLSLEEYARTNHNDSLLGWQIDGYTLQNTGFENKTIGGADGWESRCEVFTDDALIMGQSEFTFEYSGCFCSLQVYYQTPDAGEQTAGIISGITAV